MSRAAIAILATLSGCYVEAIGRVSRWEVDDWRTQQNLVEKDSIEVRVNAGVLFDLPRTQVAAGCGIGLDHRRTLRACNARLDVTVLADGDFALRGTGTLGVLQLAEDATNRVPEGSEYTLGATFATYRDDVAATLSYFESSYGPDRRPTEQREGAELRLQFRLRGARFAQSLK